MVVNLPIVAEPQERELCDAQGLHAMQLVHDSQPVEAKTAIGEAIDIFNTKGIGAPVTNLHGVAELNRQRLIAAKHSPDTTHFRAEKDGFQKDTDIHSVKQYSVIKYTITYKLKSKKKTEILKWN